MAVVRITLQKVGNPRTKYVHEFAEDTFNSLSGKQLLELRAQFNAHCEANEPACMNKIAEAIRQAAKELRG